MSETCVAIYSSWRNDNRDNNNNNTDANAFPTVPAVRCSSGYTPQSDADGSFIERSHMLIIVLLLYQTIQAGNQRRLRDAHVL